MKARRNVDCRWIRSSSAGVPVDWPTIFMSPNLGIGAQRRSWLPSGAAQRPPRAGGWSAVLTSVLLDESNIVVGDETRAGVDRVAGNDAVTGEIGQNHNRQIALQERLLVD